MDSELWRQELEKLGLGTIYLYQVLDSTNTQAEKLIQEGAPAFSLVLADAQTHGRGRQDRTWITQPGQALAFSWILYPQPGLIQPETLGRMSGLGALAVCETLQKEYDLPAEIKWPNDVLVAGKKISGILVEVHWEGCRLLDVVLGIGINVHRGALQGAGDLLFPAATLEDSLGKQVSRLELLIQILKSLQKWHRRLAEPSLITAWNEHLAYRGQQVELLSTSGVIARGAVVAVDQDGSLSIKTVSGEIQQFHSGEIRVRLVDRS